MTNFASVSGNSLPNSWAQAIDESRKASFSVQEEAEFQKHSMKLSGNRDKALRHCGSGLTRSGRE